MLERGGAAGGAGRDEPVVDPIEAAIMAETAKTVATFITHRDVEIAKKAEKAARKAIKEHRYADDKAIKLAEASFAKARASFILAKEASSQAEAAWAVVLSDLRAKEMSDKKVTDNIKANIISRSDYNAAREIESIAADMIRDECEEKGLLKEARERGTLDDLEIDIKDAAPTRADEEIKKYRALINAVSSNNAIKAGLESNLQSYIALFAGARKRDKKATALAVMTFIGEQDKATTIEMIKALFKEKGNIEIIKYLTQDDADRSLALKSFLEEILKRRDVAHLYISDDLPGLFPSLEAISKEFIKEILKKSETWEDTFRWTLFNLEERTQKAIALPRVAVPEIVKMIDESIKLIAKMQQVGLLDKHHHDSIRSSLEIQKAGVTKGYMTAAVGIATIKVADAISKAIPKINDKDTPEMKVIRVSHQRRAQELHNTAVGVITSLTADLSSKEAIDRAFMITAHHANLSVINIATDLRLLALSSITAADTSGDRAKSEEIRKMLAEANAHIAAIGSLAAGREATDRSWHDLITAHYHISSLASRLLVETLPADSRTAAELSFIANFAYKTTLEIAGYYAPSETGTWDDYIDSIVESIKKADSALVDTGFVTEIPIGRIRGDNGYNPNRFPAIAKALYASRAVTRVDEITAAVTMHKSAMVKGGYGVVPVVTESASKELAAAVVAAAEAAPMITPAEAAGLACVKAIEGAIAEAANHHETAYLPISLPKAASSHPPAAGGAGAAHCATSVRVTGEVARETLRRAEEPVADKLGRR